GRLLLVSHPQVRLYDTLAGAEVAVLGGPPLLLNKRAFFGQDGSTILYSIQGKGIYSRSFRCRTNDARGPVSIDWQPEELLARHDHGLIWNLVQSGESWVRYAPD